MSSVNPARAVVLLSGGLDSTTTLAVAQRDGYLVHALSVEYGQRHAAEIAAARAVAARARVAEHRVLALDLAAFGGSALTDSTMDVPKDRCDEAIGAGIPITYVPGRNTVLLAIAVAFAEARGADHIFLGVNHLDSSGYPDCRPDFLAAFEQAARLGTRAGREGNAIRVLAPLLTLTKAGIIRLALELGVDLSLTRSCYDPDAQDRACGRCDACRLRLRGFAEAGASDPAPYAPGGPA